MPRYGFNFLWMYHYQEGKIPQEPDEKALDFLASYGFDFVRIPTSYWFWTKDFRYAEPDETRIAFIDRYIKACQKRGIHLCLNLHRAPGYCINGNDLERHNLWVDTVAQDGFRFLWSYFAKRYKGISSKDLSFDLVNEPPAIGQYGLTRDIHANLVQQVVGDIRAIDPQREVVIDGLDGGNLAMPELAAFCKENDMVQSGRGYQPMALTHYEAKWWTGHNGLAPPVYPKTLHEAELWDKARIRKHFVPWKAIGDAGVKVHIGEFGCYNKVQNDVALAWFADLLAIFKEYKWGYSLWNFAGDFGIIDHNRPGTKYESLGGYQVDRALLEMYLANRV